jgi:endonuclease/exonuclease/phosphatase family metal-dependent hydrolase
MSTARPPRQPLTLANINIERSKHLPQVMSFLARSAPDVVCLQELIVDDLFELSRSLGYAHHSYASMALYPGGGLIRSYGIGILSRIPILHSETIPYAGLGSGRDLVDLSSADSKMLTSRYFVVLATVALADARFTIGNTHFPWTPDGSASNDQRKACGRLIGSLGERPVVLCGDFNAPRGGEIFSRLAAHWRDNIPASYTSSIDPNLHRAGPLPLMVDGAFSTNDYRVCNVVMHAGISDHCAITADIFARVVGCEHVTANVGEAST